MDENSRLKGQIKPKADWRVLYSSKNKQEDLFFFAMKSKKAKKKKSAYGFI